MTIAKRAAWSVLAAASAVAVSCYRPNRAAPCSVSCTFGATNDCPDDLECHADGICYAPNTTTCPRLPPPDGSGSGSGSGSAYCFLGQNGLLEVCFPGPATDTVSLTTNDIDTSASGPLCQLVTPNRGTTVCAMHHYDINIGSAARITAHGTYPLALLADDAITVDGTIDVSSRITGTGIVAGAGANMLCAAPAGSFLQTGGGGGGGGNQTAGGGGGNSIGNTNAAAGGGAVPVILAGGCSGGSGGGTVGKAGGSAGAGGGAVYLMSNNGIIIASSAIILAAGGAGGGGAIFAGGGGGGAGGLIAFDAPTVTFGTALLVALGGAGGAGGNITIAGQNGGETATCTAATGGIAVTGAGHGGDGGSGAGIGGSGGSATGSNAGGGGGGGGGGYIKLYAANLFGANPMACPPKN